MNSKPIFKTPEGQKLILDIYDNILKNWPVPYETLNVPTRHGETFIITCGEKTAPPLFLFHGASSNATSWIGEVEPYSRHFHVFVVDIPGDPGKSAPNRLPVNTPGYAEWMEDVLNELKIEKALMLGISNGGWTALRFATIHPDKVAKLVLLASGGIMPARASFFIKAVFYSLFGKWGIKKINKIVFGKETILEEAEKIMNVIMNNFNSRMEKEYIFSDSELKNLNMPVFIIGGDKDALCQTEKGIIRLKNLIPTAESLLIPDAGHVLVNLSDKVLPFLIKK
jgi:pimeloyl-ACP methyl ester carboxylesterase